MAAETAKEKRPKTGEETRSLLIALMQFATVGYITVTDLALLGRLTYKQATRRVRAWREMGLLSRVGTIDNPHDMTPAEHPTRYYPTQDLLNLCARLVNRYRMNI